LAAAAEAVRQGICRRDRPDGLGLRDELEAGIKAVCPRRPSFSAQKGHGLSQHHACFPVPGMKAETAVIAFDLEGRRGVRPARACSSRKGSRPNRHGFLARLMGVIPELANGASRR